MPGSLQAILDQEIALLASFIELLDAEQGALKRIETLTLPEIADKKQVVIEQLNGLELARGKALGIKPEQDLRAETLRWLNSYPENGQAASAWKKIIELARQAKQLHDLNWQLLQMHLQQTNELINALTLPARKNTLYSSDGQEYLATGSRLVDSA